MLPIHLDLGFNEIYFYEGIYFLISIAIGVYIAYVRVKKYSGKVELFDGLITWSIIGSLIGARLSHYLFWNLDLFLDNPGVLFSLSGAGNSITGGLVGGMVGGLLYTRRKNMNYFEYFSLLSPGILFAQAVGRVGCFLNGDAHGTATSSIFGVHFPRYGTTVPAFETDYGISSSAWQWSFQNGLVDQASTMSAALHPTQLYEMFGDLALMVIVLWVFKKIWDSDKKSPLIFFIHTGGYALLRFALEFIRGDREFIAFGNMTNLQVVLLGYGIFTIIYAARYYSKRKGNG
ncbi:MAG: prolipoprotein diacylglyceryl transferase [Balneolaceae bacterium]|nr:prolipoprotein diacylglyceryl transferase [Balneolaceae bacterium]MBO6545653.1 prolipoprotein diacylglyceryl transferase [Balneolaceae bacterium]MBO6647049.1 prolipoprotein diacylglyceryl transferase [Balneolaceae bacterium]